MGITLKSTYLPSEAEDGLRYFVETLWPEGVDTYDLSPYKWVQELAPSYYMKETAIWKKWDTARFNAEYRKELREPERHCWFQRMVKDVDEGAVTLLYGSRKKARLITEEDTTACALKKFIEEALNQGGEAGAAVRAT